MSERVVGSVFPGGFCTNPENTGSKEPQWLPFGQVTNHSAHSSLDTNSLNARGEINSYGVVDAKTRSTNLK